MAPDSFWKDTLKIAVAEVFATGVVTALTISIHWAGIVTLTPEVIYWAIAASAAIIFGAAVARRLTSPPIVSLARIEILPTPMAHQRIRQPSFGVTWVFAQGVGPDFRPVLGLESVRCPNDDTVLLAIAKRRIRLTLFWRCPYCQKWFERPREYRGNEIEAARALALKHTEA